MGTFVLQLADVFSFFFFFPLLPIQGFKQQALAVSTDPEHRFELALQLGELKIAYQLAIEAEVGEFKQDFKVRVSCSKWVSNITLTSAVGAEMETAG